MVEWLACAQLWRVYSPAEEVAQSVAGGAGGGELFYAACGARFGVVPEHLATVVREDALAVEEVDLARAAGLVGPKRVEAFDGSNIITDAREALLFSCRILLLIRSCLRFSFR